ncbi:MAG: hypothetical protein WCC62_09130 [Pseudomonas capeferrum]|uniref:hypothetical protein n=1 Tax=unclassified Pseudomonas TaxID=196821 RepID=UPI0023633384|nr:hypothetical protein [Pseudomonas sp. 39004]MDD1959591.1 hypothetical protein [Pseudomonas sp. 39004]
MQDEFSLWLNGNSLVLASNALGRRQINDLLDLQLLAYLGSVGEMPDIKEITEWRSLYQAIQASMGCAFTSLYSHPLPSSTEASLEPLQALKTGLTKHVPGPSQASLSRALAGLDALDRQRLQPLCQACITGCQFNAELRLLLPGPLIIGSELWFGSSEPLSCQAPGWRVDHAALSKVSAHTTTYLVDESLFDSVRDLVDETLSGKREQYRLAVNLPGGQGHE